MTLARFYLGTHMPKWLERLTDVPLMVSRNRMPKQRLPVATTRWVLDSGGFSEVSMYGGWRTTPHEYVGAVHRYQRQIGLMDWAAPQDWMCEPQQLAKTGLTVAEHQHRTVENFLTLLDLWPSVGDGPAPFIPVLQGWTLDDYWRCVDLYTNAGVRLVEHPTIGIGSVCKREATGEIAMLVRSLGSVIRLHGFGVKTDGLGMYGRWLTSADSLAWSKLGRRQPGCTSTHKSEANCMRWALEWRRGVLAEIGLQPAHQPGLFPDSRADRRQPEPTELVAAAGR